MSMYMDAQKLVPEASGHAYEETDALPYPNVKSVIKDFTDQVAYLARGETPMWLDSGGLNRDEYTEKFVDARIGLNDFTSVSSRLINGKLPVPMEELAADLNDPEKLVSMFPSILAYATPRCTRSDYLVFDVDCEVSPLLRSGLKRLVRCDTQVSGRRVIADFSLRNRSTSPPADFIKFPSGFVVTSIDSKSCTVTIVDHWMIKNRSMTPILASTNGARRLFTCLQRYYIFRHHSTKGVFRNKYYRKGARLLSTRLLHVFSNGITGVRGIDDYVTERGWIKDEESGEAVQVFKKEMNNGEWKSAVGSVKVEAASSMVSSLLQGPSDIWKNLPAFEMGDLQFQIWSGHEHPTKNIENICFSIYQIKRPGKSDAFLIEETNLDEPMLVVRAILDGPILESIVRKDGVNPSAVDLLPYGIVIHPDPASQGCIVTMGYQFKTDQFMDIDAAKTMITSTLSSFANVGDK